MSKRIPFLAIAVCLLLAVACKKSNHSGSGTNPLIGTWNFEGETTHADITSTASLGPLTVTVVNLIDFRTINNQGTFAFTADSLDLTGVGYMIDTTYTSITNTGISIDTLVSPLTDTTKPGNNSVSYKLVGQDSIYFPNGSLFALNVDSIQPPIQLTGAHFTISGNTLTLNSNIYLSGNETVHGITAPTTGPIKSVITLTKQ